MSTTEPVSPRPGLQLISPGQAANLLATRAVNRSLKGANVSFLRRQIEEDRWRPTAGTLGLNEDGQLVEGQHRCQAIVEAGRSVEIEVRLIAQADVLAVDTGAQRSAADLFAIRNIANPSQAAACIRIVASLRASVGKPAYSQKAGAMLSNEELWEILKADSGYAISAETGRVLKEHTPFVGSSQLAALYYVFSNASSPERATAFLNAVAFDSDMNKMALTYNLRRWLLRAEAQKRKPSKYHAIVLFVAAWNRWLKGETGRPAIPRTVPAVQGPKPERETVA